MIGSNGCFGGEFGAHWIRTKASIDRDAPATAVARESLAFDFDATDFPICKFSGVRFERVGDACRRLRYDFCASGSRYELAALGDDGHSVRPWPCLSFPKDLKVGLLFWTERAAVHHVIGPNVTDLDDHAGLPPRSTSKVGGKLLCASEAICGLCRIVEKRRFWPGDRLSVTGTRPPPRGRELGLRYSLA